MKGISPVIASIVLVLIVLSLASTYVVFTNRLTQDTTSQVEEQTAETRRLATTQFSIENVDGQNTEVRNIGQQPIDVNGLRVTIDDATVNYTMNGRIEAGDSGTLTLKGLWRFGPGEHSLRISGAARSDTMTVRIEPVREDRVLDMRFEEDSGRVANDLSGNENNGQLGAGNISRMPAWTNGKFGKALNFDGADDFVRIDSLAGYTGGTTPLTIEAWAKTDTVASGTVMIAETGTDATLDGLSIERRTAQWAARIGSGPAQTGGVAAIGTWSHVVGTWKDGTVSLYVDGTLIGSGDDGVSANLDMPLTVGGSGSTPPDELFDGVIDEVRVYNAALEPDQLYVLKKV